MKKNVLLLLAACMCLLCSAYAAADTVSLTAVVPGEHIVSFTIGEHGSVQYGGQIFSGTASIPVQRFGSAEIIIVPDAGYKLDTVTVSSGEYLACDGTAVTVFGIAEDMFVQLSFTESEIRWGEPVYEWSADNTSVTATCTALNDPRIVKTETAAVTGTVLREPTGTALGVTLYTAVFEDPLFTAQNREIENIAMVPHCPVTDPAVTATCAEEGLTEGSHCAVCGAVLVPQELVAKTSDHQYAMDPAVPASCETPGLTSGFHCELCGEVFVAQSVIPALGHAWGEADYLWDDDHSKVTGSVVCTRDPSHTVSETVAARKIILSPTEDQAGLLEWVSDAFASDMFTVQEKNIAAIPALGTLRVLRLPDSLTEIGEEAFAGGSFEAVIIPESCRIISDRAFGNCVHLIYVKVPAGTSIAPGAFAECPNVIIDIAAE